MQFNVLCKIKSLWYINKSAVSDKYIECMLHGMNIRLYINELYIHYIKSRRIYGEKRLLCMVLFYRHFDYFLFLKRIADSSIFCRNTRFAFMLQIHVTKYI